MATDNFFWFGIGMGIFAIGLGMGFILSLMTVRRQAEDWEKVDITPESYVIEIMKEYNHDAKNRY